MDRPIDDRFSLPPMPTKMLDKWGHLTEAAIEWYERCNAIALKNQQPRSEE